MFQLKKISIVVLSLSLITACHLDDTDDFTQTTPQPVTPRPTTPVFGGAAAGLVDGSVTTAQFSNPVNVEVGQDGMVYVADYDNDAIRRIDPNGQVSTLVKQANFNRPFGLTLSADARDLYVQTDGNDLGQRDSTTGTVWRIALTGQPNPTVIVRNVGRPRGLQALPDGQVAFTDLVKHTVSILNPSNQVITPLAGQSGQAGFVDGTGSIARFSRPYGLALSADGALLVADQNNHSIRKVTRAGVVTTFIGKGPAQAGHVDGVQASATFNFPQDIAVFGQQVYVADHDNHVIRRIADGWVTTPLGSGTQGYAEGSGRSVAFFGLEGIALTPDGATLWVADGNNGDGDAYNRVRWFATQ